MRIEGDTLRAKTSAIIWPTERDGSKSNTLREINDKDERDAYIKWKCHDGPIFVCIENAETGETFTRRVASIVDKMIWPPMKNWVLISWRHEE